MSKRLILILTLAFVVGIAFTAYAEVQNVKVSGDITVKGVAREDFDLANAPKQGPVVTSNFDDKNRDILSITRVRVDADLTDNVSTTVRLLNERNWDGESNTAGDATTASANRNIGLNNMGGDADEAEANRIDLDLAYVTLKEFLYSPLSLSIGRQELHFGTGLVVGDPDTNIYSALTQLAEGDLSARKSFDAVRATLDYNPLVVDAVYAKITEGAVNLNDDVTLSGLNASYALNKSTTLEGYFFSKVKGDNAAEVYNNDAGVAIGGSAVAFGSIKDKPDIVNVLGVRAVDKSVKNLTLDGQLAWQSGRYNPKFDANARFHSTERLRAQTTKRNAWAGQLMAAYDLKDIALVSKYSPVISGHYTYLSGANRDETGKRAYKGWDPMFENQTEGHIINAIFANTNMHRAGLSAKAKLTDDIAVDVDYISAWFAKRYPKGGSRVVTLSGVYGTTAANSGSRFILLGENKYIGQEIDATLTYDYTEDVQFSLMGGVFFVGDNIRDIEHPYGGNQTGANELIGSMKVTF